MRFCDFLTKAVLELQVLVRGYQSVEMTHLTIATVLLALLSCLLCSVAIQVGAKRRGWKKDG